MVRRGQPYKSRAQQKGSSMRASGRSYRAGQTRQEISSKKWAFEAEKEPAKKKEKKPGRKLINGMVYDKEQYTFDTRKEVDERVKRFRKFGHNAMYGKDKDGFFVWYRKKNQGENKALRDAGLKKGDMVLDKQFHRKYYIVGAYRSGPRYSLETVDVTDKELSKGSLNILALKEARYTVYKK
jgi:hypothetical protein